MYVNINRSELFLYKYFFAVLHYTLLEIETRILSALCPRFRIAWKLMYRYSMRIACVFTTCLVFCKPATRYLPLYLLCFRAEAVPEPTR